MERAVTFDLWDTLFVDDSDADERSRRGLPTRFEAGRRAFAGWAVGRGVEEAAARAALDEADAAFLHAWKVQHRTPHLRERLADAAGRVGLAPDGGLEDVVEAIACLEVDVPPLACEGAVDALSALKAAGWRMGIVSDAIVTPGSHLRRLLAARGMDRFFDAFVFSDEAGASKPDPRVFELAASGLGVPVSSLIHVGDREANDVAGPHGVGARAVLYVGAKDRRDGSTPTRADAVCDDLRTLPDLLARLARGAA